MYPEFQQIYWYSGIYLQPQHLQSVDLHHNYMLSRFRQFAHPWNLGIINCDINIEILADFSFKIEKLQAILPSGEFLEYPGNCTIRPRQFRDLWKKLEKPFTFWLALRRFDPGYANVGDSPNSRWIRSSEEGSMKDVYGSGSECNVSRILYNVQILSDDEKCTAIDCEFLPLVKFCYENGKVTIDSEFSPPLITLNGSSSFKRLLDGLYADLANRAHKFEEYKRPLQYEGLSERDMIQLLVMRSLNRILPLFNHYCNSPMVHPWHIYGLLAQLIGELSSFCDDCSFRGELNSEGLTLLPYDHFNLFDCFSNAKKIIVNLLINLNIDNSSFITLMPDKLSIYRAELKNLSWKQACSVVLALSSDTIDTLCSDFKISPASKITTLIQHALPGIAVTRLKVPPRGVPNKKNTLYFLINKDDPLCESFEQDGCVAFYLDNTPEDLLVQMIFMEEK